VIRKAGYRGGTLETLPPYADTILMVAPSLKGAHESRERSLRSGASVVQ
jgi:hypothetical protein